MPGPRSAIAFHDERAGRWSAGYHASPHFTRRARDWQAAMRDHLEPHAHLLDVGCGSGDLSVIAARLGAIPTCIDGSPAMVAEARGAVGAVSPEARFFAADAAALPVADGEFDVAIASSLLEYLDPLAPALAEIRRAIRPGGLFLCTVPNPRSLYRRLEGQALRLTGRPAYRRFVNPDIYRRDIAVDLRAAGFEPLESRLLGLPPRIPGGALAAIAERHPLLATMTLIVSRAV